jgi:hypothetical protein
MAEEKLQTGSIPNRIGPQPTGDTTRVAPVVARGPVLGAAIGGALATIGASLMAVPFPLPWIGPVVGSVLVGVGVIIAAVNGVSIDPARLSPPRTPEK